ARVAVEPLQQSTKYLDPYVVKAGTLQKNARMHVAGNFHAASPSRSKPLSRHMDMRKSARESLDRFMSTRREQLFCPPKLVSRSFPGNYGRIKHGTSSSIANKCCKRHTVSAAAPKFFAFVVIRCVESFYAVFTNPAVTNAIVTRSAYRQHGADKCDLF